jgi:hypothetical protein
MDTFVEDLTMQWDDECCARGCTGACFKCTTAGCRTPAEVTMGGGRRRYCTGARCSARRGAAGNLYAGLVERLTRPSPGGRVVGMAHDVTESKVEQFKALLEREMAKEFSPSARERLTREQLVAFCARHDPAQGEHAYRFATDWFIADELDRRA